MGQWDPTQLGPCAICGRPHHEGGIKIRPGPVLGYLCLAAYALFLPDHIQPQNVLLEADPSAGLRVVATDLELTVARRARATVDAAGRTTVPARLLADYVGLLDRGAQVSLALAGDGSRLQLGCERYQARIATLPAEDFPPAPAVADGVDLELDGAVPRRAIEHVVFAAATDDSRPVLAGVLVRVAAGRLTLVASDGYRLAVRDVSHTDDPPADQRCSHRGEYETRQRDCRLEFGSLLRAPVGCGDVAGKQRGEDRAGDGEADAGRDLGGGVGERYADRGPIPR